MAASATMQSTKKRGERSGRIEVGKLTRSGLIRFDGSGIPWQGARYVDYVVMDERTAVEQLET